MKDVSFAPLAQRAINSTRRTRRQPRRHPLAPRCAAALLIVCAMGAALPPAAYAADTGDADGRRSSQAAPARSQTAVLPSGHPDLWIVSTRHLSSHPGAAPPRFRVRRYQPCQGWRSACLDELFEVPPDTRLVVYIHGNRVESPEVVPYGWRAFRVLAGAGRQPRMRMVVWSWPSDRIRGLLRDFRSKAQRTEAEGFYLAGVLARARADQDISLMAYSYGGRIVTGALHLLAGGQLAGHRAERAAHRAARRVRVTLLAPAVHHTWLSPGGRHSRAWERIGRLDLLYNSRDRVLRRYHMLERCTRPLALGRTGLPFSARTARGAIVRQFNVAPLIGHTHLEERYYARGTIRARIRAGVLEALD